MAYFGMPSRRRLRGSKNQVKHVYQCYILRLAKTHWETTVGCILKIFHGAHVSHILHVCTLPKHFSDASLMPPTSLLGAPCFEIDCTSFGHYCFLKPLTEVYASSTSTYGTWWSLRRSQCVSQFPGGFKQHSCSLRNSKHALMIYITDLVRDPASRY